MSSPVSCPDPAAKAPCRSCGDPSPGQILVMFAIFLIGMLGMLGLCTDLGVAFMQRRTVQAAADAGALAGTRIVAKSTASRPLAARADVEAVVVANMSAVGSIGSIDCSYVNDNGQPITDCAAIVPAGASGVRVKVTELHPTYFIQVVPGAPSSVSTNGSARANIKMLGYPTDGPFLPCGVDTRLASGGRLSMLIKEGGEWVINPDAVGETFEIHGPRVEKCDAKAERYKGLADVDVNRDRSASGWFMYKEGDSAGMISQDVEGLDGCKAGQEVVDCVVFLPIAVNDPAESGNDRQLWVVAFSPFYVTAPKANEHHGKLISDYMVYGRGQDGNWGWTPEFEGPITIRLTE
jgi:Flp pilus assembly protein TadG